MFYLEMTGTVGGWMLPWILEERQDINLRNMNSAGYKSNKPK